MAGVLACYGLGTACITYNHAEYHNDSAAYRGRYVSDTYQVSETFTYPLPLVAARRVSKLPPNHSLSDSAV